MSCQDTSHSGPIDRPLELAEIIDVPAIQGLMDHFHELVHIPMAIIDLKGKVLVGVGWQDICTQFHRVHPDTCRHCIESDLELTAPIPPGQCRLYQCKNHMWDMATPITVEDQRVGNLFTGQFFFAGEPVDRELFMAQARQYGFDEGHYLAALDAVPRLSRETVNTGMAFFMKLAQMISQLSYSNIELARLVAQREALTNSLRQSEQRLQVTLTSIGDAVITCDTEGRITFLNPVAEQLSGWTTHEAIGRPIQSVFRIINERTRQPAEDLVSRVLRERCIIGLANHTSLITKDGQERPIEDSAAPIIDGAGRVSGVVLVFHDVAEQRQAEAALQRLNRTLRAHNASSHALMRATSEPHYLQEACRIIVEDCGHAMVWIGYAEEDEARSVRPVAYSGFEQGYLETLGITWADTERGQGPTGTAIRTGQVSMCRNMLLDPRFSPWRAEALRRGYASSIVLPLVNEGKVFGAISIYCRQPDPFSDDEVKLLSDLASDVAYGITAIRLRDANQRAEHGLRSAKVALERANAAKDEFIATLSHELRTPLTPVLAAASSMLKDSSLSVDMREDLELIHRNVGLEVALINDLLDVTRIAAGKLVLHKRPVNVARVLREAARICSIDLDGRSQILTIDTHGEPYPMEADAARLNQVFWNLIKNAIKFTPAGGRIAIRAQVRATNHPLLLVSVSDSGIGIEEDVLPRIFDRFEQGEAGTTRLFGGLGLGLAICKTIVEMHGGRISAQSQGKDRGATFTVELPVGSCQLPPESGSPVRGAGNSQRTTPLRILLVEDHADTAKLMSRLLAADGHSVLRAGSIGEALTVAGTEQVDLIISDLGLPDGTGHDLIRQLLASGKSIKAIALSGYGAAADVQKSLDVGFAEHLTKPVDLDNLRSAIGRVVRG